MANQRARTARPRMSLAHFKKKSQPAARPWLVAADAKALDAASVAAALGVGLTQQGRHCELAGGERGTLVDDRMVWCTKDGTGIGDNIALVQHVAGIEFYPALELLLGETSPRPAAAVPAAKVLRVPVGTQGDRLAGRAYLAGRGIAHPALDTAEAAGMLRYTSGAVLFVGYDLAGKLRSATRRGYLVGDPDPKRDLSGSDKRWPAIIAGSEAGEVWIVEGGADALALCTLRPGSTPSVIVTGGIHVVAWLENPLAVALLAKAWRVVIAGEREKNEETQVKTDALREKLKERLSVHCPEVSIWIPPAESKDLADSIKTV